MSAIRHERRGSRAIHASPYARPSQNQSWGFSRLFNLLNPLRFRNQDDASDSEESSVYLPISSGSTETGDASQVTAMQPSGSQDTRPRDPPRDRRFRPSMDSTSPQKQSIAALDLGNADDSSPTKNIEIVTQFLEERGGKSMSSVELEVYDGSDPPLAEKHEPFRFSFSTSPTPGRSDSPDTVAECTNPNEGNQAPRRMMTKNPNGVYRWRGGGSAGPARSRNRYVSPAFGPSRGTPDRLVLKDSTATGEGFKADNKRRRIGEEAASPSVGTSAKLQTPANGPQATSADASNVVVPSNAAPSAHPVNGQLKVNGMPNGSVPFRLRTTGLQKPTTPTVPSPLRQAWSGSSSDVSTGPVQTPLTPPKPTKAANLMAELIKEVTPPKKADVSNPYQTASPVKITPSVSRPRPKRPRPAARPTQPETVKPPVDSEETKVTPQAIIEATLPKGSKRARPPAHLERPTVSESPAELDNEEKSPPNHEPFGKEMRTEAYYTVEEVDEDEEARARAAKKPKPHVNGRGAPTARKAFNDDLVIEELQDVEMSNGNEKSVSMAIPPCLGAASKSTFGHKPSSVPREPSKLRFSYKLENATSQAVPETAPSPEAAPEAKSGKPVSQQTVVADPKATAHALPANSLPSFTFTFAVISTFTPSPAEKLAREQALSKAESSLPTFTFSSDSGNTVAPAPVKAFDWSAAGIKPPPLANAGGNWTCSTCSLSNPASATEKCTICDAPR